ncbi:MAG TPA: murein transglycosylase A [Burkholderiales bacterium]|nr:murein transglycosylase A [Burkholderiales bacterium]
MEVPKAPPLAAATFADLPGWQDDGLVAAWPAYSISCGTLKNKDAWREVCQEAAIVDSKDAGAIRRHFETWFRPYRMTKPDGVQSGLITGYYEPLLRGSRHKSGAFIYPLYAPPDDLLTIDLSDVAPDTKNIRLRGRIEGRKVVPYYSRADIERGAAPVKGKELVWVDDAIEAFFLQIQGSGRVKLPDGSMVRVGYADQNGHPYQSIGRYLIDKGELQAHEASMQGIQSWARAHPERLQELLNQNPSYVFFRELDQQQGGPIGALGVPLTTERSIAVDPRYIPLGAPVWLNTTRPNTDVPMQRLMFAQDTGGAIRGPVRADFFWGFGPAAGQEAGRMKQQGELWVLLPLNYPPPKEVK